MHLPPEQGLHIALAARLGLGRLHVVADAGEALEIGLDVGAGLAPADAELGGEPDRRDAVHDAEIDGLGAAPYRRVHALDRHAEHFARGHGVDVEPVGEGLAQRRRVGHMGKHAKLDLAVVGRDQPLALLRHEGLADGAAFTCTHRDVLQIRLERREPPRGGGGERVGSVHAPSLGVDVGGQCVGIGALELGEQAPVEHLARQLVAFGGKLLERARVGAPGAGLGAPAAGETHLVEQDLAELLRRADVEVLAGKLPDLVFEARDGLREIAGERRERRALDPDAGPLHQRQHRRDRPLQGLVDGVDMLGDQPRLQHEPEP